MAKKKKSPHNIVNASIAKERRHPTHATTNFPPKLKKKGAARRR